MAFLIVLTGRAVLFSVTFIFSAGRRKLCNVIDVPRSQITNTTIWHFNPVRFMVLIFRDGANFADAFHGWKSSVA